jgi:hypothetical protein
MPGCNTLPKVFLIELGGSATIKQCGPHSHLRQYQQQ